jgi:hypothetical protein
MENLQCSFDLPPKHVPNYEYTFQPSSKSLPSSFCHYVVYLGLRSIGPIGLFRVIAQSAKSCGSDNSSGRGSFAQSQYGIVTRGLKSRILFSSSTRYSLCQGRKLLPPCAPHMWPSGVVIACTCMSTNS